jgi:hypothetical protein
MLTPRNEAGHLDLSGAAPSVCQQFARILPANMVFRWKYSDGILMLNPIEPKRLTTSWELKFTPAFPARSARSTVPLHP